MRRLILEEPYSRAAIWSRRLAVFALAVAGMAAALSRAGAVEPAGALAVLGASLVLACLAGLLSATAAVVIWRTGRLCRAAARAGARRLSRLSLLARDLPADDQRRLDRSRDAAELPALGAGARGARRAHAARGER
jgi:hypothetical protein